MLEFFRDGGWSMYPITVVGLVLLSSSAFYAADHQPIRLRLIVVLGLALFAFSSQGFLVDVSHVLWVVATDERILPADRLGIALQGFKESTRPVILGFGLTWLSLILVAVGIYRSGRQELRAARS